MTNNILAEQILKELEAEAPASRKCLERMPADKFDFKPHEKSMAMGYLATIVADIPRWIAIGVKEGDIDFGTFKRIAPKNAEELVAEFDKNMADAREVLGKTSDKDLEGKFSLRAGDKIFMSSTKLEMASSTINHGVHHRGQLTVYLRLCGVPVPSTYGPSADEKTF